MIASGDKRIWLWTVYGTSDGGMEETFEEAQRFRLATGGGTD